MRLRISTFYNPKFSQEDLRRQEYILNIILCISIVVLVLFDLVIFRNSIVKAHAYDGVEFLTFTGITLIYIALLVLSKRGYVKIASYGLIFSYWAGALYCGYQWGASLPMTIVVFILIIFISSIIINSKFGLIITAVAIVSFIFLGIHEYHNPHILSWRLEAINNTDFITFSLLLVFVSLLSQLSNRQIEQSLKRARGSEHALRLERDTLEIRIEERTKDLKELQLARMNELEKVAEFGRLSQGLLHDLLSPLNAIVLHMGKIKDMPPEELEKSHISLDKIVESSFRMNENIMKLRHSMKNSMPSRICHLHEEIKNCVDLLQFKAREHNVLIEVIKNDDCTWYGDPIKLRQIFLNILSNAIDACALTVGRQRTVKIGTSKVSGYSTIVMEDNGIGIDETALEKIFDPFFTTKSPEYGTGIGLTTARRNIIEMGGEIKVKSRKDEGSEFIVSIPV